MRAGRVVKRRARLRRAMRAADLLALVWVAGWVTVAVFVGIDVGSLAELPGTLYTAGKAIVDTGNAIHSLSGLPLVGHQLSTIGHQVAATGARAQATASSTGTSVHQLSWLLPVVVALVPIVPVMVVYLPLRVQRAREIRAVSRMLATAGGDRQLRTLLAQRAVANLPFHRLQEVTEDPWADLEAGRVAALADAELDRLGINPSTVLPPHPPSSPDAAPSH